MSLSVSSIQHNQSIYHQRPLPLGFLHREMTLHALLVPIFHDEVISRWMLCLLCKPPSRSAYEVNITDAPFPIDCSVAVLVFSILIVHLTSKDYFERLNNSANLVCFTRKQICIHPFWFSPPQASSILLGYHLLTCVEQRKFIA